MNQTRKRSWQEAFTNTAVGYGFGLAGQMVIFPLLGMDVSFNNNMIICMFFTVISIIRNYIIRRFFNTFKN